MYYNKVLPLCQPEKCCILATQGEPHASHDGRGSMFAGTLPPATLTIVRSIGLRPRDTTP